MTPPARKRSPVVELVHNLFDWYPSYLSKEERWFLRKLDCSILTFSTLSYFVMHLDQSNIQNAYVSGMQQKLGLVGNDLNYLSIAYYAAYAAGQVPMLLVQTRPRFTRWFLPSLTVVWAILTFCQSCATKPWHLYLIRALIGLAESPSFTGTHYVLGSWYRPEELFKRAGTWFTAYSLGSMFSGYLQAAAYKNLNGVAGREGWQWLFIIDGIFTLPIAFIGFALYPGLPTSPKPWFLSNEEYELAQRRLPKDHKQSGKLSLAAVKRAVATPMFWLTQVLYICLVVGTYWTSLMTLWLKAEGYTTEKVNIYATFIPLIAAASSWVGASLAGGGVVPAWAVYSVGQLAMLFCTIVLFIWNIPRGLKFFAFYLSGFSGIASPVLFSWINVTLRNDPEQRAFITSAMLTTGYAFNIWIPLLTFPTVESPVFRKGYASCIGLVLGCWTFTLAAFWWYGRKASARKEFEVESRGETKSEKGSLEEEDAREKGVALGLSAGPVV